MLFCAKCEERIHWISRLRGKNICCQFLPHYISMTDYAGIDSSILWRQNSCSPPLLSSVPPAHLIALIPTLLPHAHPPLILLNLPSCLYLYSLPPLHPLSSPSLPLNIPTCLSISCSFSFILLLISSLILIHLSLFPSLFHHSLDSHLDPLNPFSHVFLLLLFEDEFNE